MFFSSKSIDKKTLEILIQGSKRIENAVEKVIVECTKEFGRIDTLEREIESLKKTIKEAEGRFDTYYKPLSDKVDKLHEKTKPSIGQLALQKFSEDQMKEIQENIKNPKISLYNSPRITTTDAIIDAMRMSGNKLHYKEIFDIIENYNLLNPDVTLDTVKATLYSLAKRKKIKNGTKKGTFYIKEKKGL